MFPVNKTETKKMNFTLCMSQLVQHIYMNSYILFLFWGFIKEALNFYRTQTSYLSILRSQCTLHMHSRNQPSRRRHRRCVVWKASLWCHICFGLYVFLNISHTNHAAQWFKNGVWFVPIYVVVCAIPVCISSVIGLRAVAMGVLCSKAFNKIEYVL